MTLHLQHVPIAVSQLMPEPFNIRGNVAKMLADIERAKAQGMKLIVFGELVTSGYMLGDEWENESLIREIERANEEIARASAGITVVWGSVKADYSRFGEDGRIRKYNAAFIAHNGRWLRNAYGEYWVPKTNLPKYRIFDDARHFYPADKLAAELGIPLAEFLRPFEVRLNGGTVKVALTVCEDLWEDEYNTKPSRIYAGQGVDLIVDISSSPWTAGKWHARANMLRDRAQDAKAWVLYVNICGLQNNTKNLVWFDGASCLVDPDGYYRWEAPANTERLVYLKPQELDRRWATPTAAHTHEIEEIYEVQIAVRRAFYQSFPRVVTGASGGIDSAVELALNVDALGPAKVLAVNMPTKFNSQTTRTLAKQLADNLGIEYRISPIEEVYETELAALGTRGRQSNSYVQENIQARARGSRLARIAADEGGVFTCNGNKTEVALNYFTLYGDGAGAAAMLADLWKGQIYDLARYINKRHMHEVIPTGIINIVPSAELSAEQNVDEGKGDPIFYPYHDKLLRAFTEQRRDPEWVLEHLRWVAHLEDLLGCPRGTVREYFTSDEELISNLEWCWNMYHREFKRHQLPPVLICSRRAFGFDRRAAIGDAYFTEEYYRLKQELLTKAA